MPSQNCSTPPHARLFILTVEGVSPRITGSRITRRGNLSAACADENYRSHYSDTMRPKVDNPTGEEQANMRLSESILLGSTLVKSRAGALRFARNNEGCALGMAAIAAGCTFVRPTRQILVNDLRTGNVEAVFGPWLLRVVMRPCECPAELRRDMRIKDIIAHLFDVHVKEKKEWSLDQLVHWVERWEPGGSHYRSASEGDPVPADPVTPAQGGEQTAAAAEEAEWRSSREKFEAKHQSKPRGGPKRR